MIDRIVLAHTVVLSLAGVPAFYINSVLATTSDLDAVRHDDVRRSINRSRVALDDVPPRGGSSWQSRLMDLLLERAQLRRRQPAFHPDAEQHVSSDGPVLRIERGSGPERITALHNMSDQAAEANVPSTWRDLLSSRQGTGAVQLGPYESAWLRS